ncbi:hypothetical protein SNR37_000414 [Agarivorans aestuarii]|uniref:Uncharacterized protein n=1 Tax=Agarivorans aestuarii TaxID=1563703 RepID=A0ABU7G798_9ALTE|nr:hypothetical protein [Agarivorans aestuarii]MEE1675092.1 hypothetical protein [Agarivorans aestuarii]
MRLISKILLFIFISTISFISSGNESFLFEKLQLQISKYSSKLEQCQAQRALPQLNGESIAKLKPIIEESPLALSYLSNKATNECLQPERSELAESILAALSDAKNKSTLELAKSTGKLTFGGEAESEKVFFSLPIHEQKLLLEEPSLQVPFARLETFELLIGM